MRLLETTDGRTYRLTEDFRLQSQVPPYAILSHTWEEDQEVTFDDINKDTKSKYRKLRSSLRLRPRSEKRGYKKLRFCARQAKRDGLRFFWVDTCCIDKSNSSELQKAINSMFQWYQNAAKCYVYLSDVSTAGAKRKSWSSALQEAFMGSRWFTRGWTLQELLAPKEVYFFSKEGACVGSRSELKQLIHDITNIPPRALSGAPLKEFGVDERLSWAVGRQTTRIEDEVYSLLGIFNVQLPFIYNEGYDKALRRLLDEIHTSHIDVDQGSPEDMLRSTIPFRRDRDFISCGYLDAVHRRCTKPAGCTALVGLGGVGKSQIAIEYAYQVLLGSLNTWVFWVQADTKTRLLSSFHKIAEKTRMDGWDDPKADILQVVGTWLSVERNGKWLMVIDSADDASVFDYDASSSREFDPSALKPSAWTVLTQSSVGSILVTSRSHEVARFLTGSESSVLEVGPMTSHDAFALLQKKWTSTLQRSEADPLIEGLDYMPLALTQAAAFINRTPRMSIKTYMENVEYDEARLMDNNVVDIRRDAQASNSVMATWQTSFNYIHDRSLSAARLLSLMSLFDRQGIPRSLIEGEYTDDEHDTSSFEHDMYMLTSFCLVKASADGISFEMHGLVQYATKKWLHLNDKLEYWKKIYATLINKSFLVGKAEHWPVCRMLFPHVQTALNHHCFKDADALEEWASIAHKAGRYMDYMGEVYKAHKLISDSLGVREILLPPDDPDILDTLNTLGVALGKMDRYDEAKTIYERAIKALERIYGIEDTWTLITMLNLASLYDNYGHWTEAEALLSQVLEAASQIDTNDGRLLKLRVLGVIASNKDSLGHYEESVALRLQVLQALEQEFGPDHQRTVTAKANLAHTYYELGRYKEAEKMQLEVIKIHERENHAEPEIICAKGHLASILQEQGRWKEAEALHLEVLEKTKAKLGPEHSETLSAMGYLASIYWTQGRFHEAETLNLELLARKKATFGEDHRSVFVTKGSLATSYASLERYAESEALGLEVLQYWKAKLGDRHPQTLLHKGNLASTYRDQGKFDVAQQMEEDVLQARREILGVEHPTTLGTLGNLAVTHRRQGLKEKAYELMEECYQGHIKVRGSEHPITTRYKAGLEKWRREDGLLTEKM